MTVDRLAHLDDDELGRAVATLDLRWPPAPEVVGSVLREIEHGAPARRRLSRTTVVLLVAAAILAIAAAAAAARFAVDLGGIEIRSVPTMPTLPASPVEPRIGEAVTFDQAERALGEPLPTLPALGDPDRVWLQRGTTSFEPSESGIVVAMAWLSGPDLPSIPGTPYGATLFVFRGEPTVAIKTVPGRVHQIAAHDAMWIHAQHELDLLVNGRLRSFRVTGGVLIWQDGDLAVRLESGLQRDAAVRLAFPPRT